MKYLTQLEAINIDKHLLTIYKLEQLVELAGLSIAQAIRYLYPNNKNVLICCGSGNNGADGLVAARHLSLWSYQVKVWAPSLNSLKDGIDEKLIKAIGVELIDNPDIPVDLIVDALLGFGSKGDIIREPIKSVLDIIINKSKNVPTVAVDIPTGWQVDKEKNNMWMPETLLSIMAPKRCALGFTGLHHLIAGRFLPVAMVKELELPNSYENDFQYFIKLSSS